MATHHLRTPLAKSDVLKLRCGDMVILSGRVYSARDAAHRLMMASLDQGQALPFDPDGAVIYYVGPTPAPPGRAIGAAGPTTSGRMDVYAPRLYDLGIKATIGKGRRNSQVREALVRNRAVYLAATGGAGALLSSHISKATLIAYPELGPEAVMELIFEGFPLLVANDAHGQELYPETCL